MKLVKLRPIQYPKTLQAELEREIKKTITREVYLPLLKLLNLKRSTVKNALTQRDTDVLGEALLEGELTYHNGMFSGALNAGLTRALRDAGAKWDSRLSVYRLSQADLPQELDYLIRLSSREYQDRMRAVNKYLTSLDPEQISGRVAVNRLFENALKKTEKSFEQNVGAITLAPSLTDEDRARVVDRWKIQAHDSIQGLVRDQVKALRARVAQSVEVGTRYSNLVKGIQHEHEVSAGRAKLIARTETKTLVNAYAKQRYEDAGVSQYYWRCVHGTSAHPVRDEHQDLANRSSRGELFSFDKPPLLMENGQYGNPGDPWNCRCWAEPVVKFGGS